MVPLRRLLTFGLFTAVAAPAQTLVNRTLAPRIDVFVLPAKRFTLSAAPASSDTLMVFVNGLLMLEGLDYWIDGRTLEFLAQPTEQMDAPKIQVRYWV